MYVAIERIGKLSSCFFCEAECGGQKVHFGGIHVHY